MVELRDKDRLAEAITEDVVNILKIEKKDVIIVFEEASHGTGMLLESVSNYKFNAYSPDPPAFG